MLARSYWCQMTNIHIVVHRNLQTSKSAVSLWKLSVNFAVQSWLLQQPKVGRFLVDWHTLPVDVPWIPCSFNLFSRLRGYLQAETMTLKEDQQPSTSRNHDVERWVNETNQFYSTFKIEAPVGDFSKGDASRWGQHPHQNFEFERQIRDG